MTGFEIEDVGAPTAPTSAARLVDIPVFNVAPPTTLDLGDVGSPGISPDVSRSDHEHPFPAPAFVAPVAGVGNLGASPRAAREDHEHEGVHSVNLATGDVIVTPFPGYGPAPASIEIGDAGSPGLSPVASRSDHEHPMLAPVAVGPVAAAGSLGVSPTAAREDHEHEGVHSVNAATGDVIVSEFPGYGPAPEQIDAGDGPNAGVALTAARSDHQHGVNTAAAADLSAVDAGASSGGASTTIPRGDHKHTVTTAAPVNVDKSANAAGVAAALSRADHKHDVTTAVASASIDIGDAAGEGIATSLARSDHQHPMPAPPAGYPVNVDTGAEADGVATTAARSDHKHAAPTIPTTDEKAALVGTSGAPSAANKYVTDSDPRLVGLAMEVYQDNPFPVGPVNGNGTRVAQTTLEGAAFRIYNKKVEFNRIVWRATGQSGAPTVRILIYQSADGGLTGPFNLIAQATGIAVGAAGNFITALDAGATANLQPGWCFILFGRDSAAGSATFRTFVTLANDLYNANVPAGVVPTCFTTTISATGAVAATFDPLAGTVTPSSSDLAADTILRKV